AAWVVGLMFTASLSAPELVRWIAARPGRLRRPAGPAGGATSRGGERAPRPGPGTPSPTPGNAPPAGTGPGRGTFAPAALPTVKEIGKKEVGREAEVPIPPAPPAPAYEASPLIIGGEQHWELPGVEEMLEVGVESTADDKYDRDRARTIEETLASFGAPATVKEINRGPTITQFCVEPEMTAGRAGKQTRVKVGKISALANDLALALAATSIRIEAPVPGKGYVGIEVPNIETSLVALRDVMESENFRRSCRTRRTI
ncbi:MAG: hypothetical protein HY784_05715, partial [Chloroflexi bacterium]|nr:hypothetical protein [Chloroflexota bacterium]